MLTTPRLPASLSAGFQQQLHRDSALFPAGIVSLLRKEADFDRLDVQFLPIRILTADPDVIFRTGSADSSRGGV